jgi:hypothetical protein
MEPIVHGLESEFEPDVMFERVDASTSRGRTAMSAFSLRGHPSYVLLDEEGAVVWQFAGQVDEAQLRAEMVNLAP